VLILGAISNGLVLINMGAYLQMVVKGCILLGAVALDAVKSRVSE
jgi:ribose transport system permease protein